MSERVQPQIFLVAETQIQEEGIQDMLEELGMSLESAQDWLADNVGAETVCGELLIEVAGRLCYKSFEPGLNKNVTKIREGNKAYLGNILGQKHGSVLEHATVSIAMIGVSRIFTHEVVRNRAGNAFSQESLRYVRLDEQTYRFPSIFEDDDFLTAYHIATGGEPGASKTTIEWFKTEMREQFQEVFDESEKRIAEIYKKIDIDEIKDFELKKKITSALRRLAPAGLCTNILVTGNHRAWRYMIEQRTSFGAEEEIQEVISLVARIFKERFPNIYQDMEEIERGVWGFQNSKV